jgi:hypothetical protein
MNMRTRMHGCRRRNGRRVYGYRICTNTFMAYFEFAMFVRVVGKGAHGTLHFELLRNLCASSQFRFDSLRFSFSFLYIVSMALGAAAWILLSQTISGFVYRQRFNFDVPCIWAIRTSHAFGQFERPMHLGNSNVS